MGRAVAPKPAHCFARVILELGGNNAAVVTPTADLDLTLREGVAFGAMGTAGERCTTLRRLFVHESVYDSFVSCLNKVYATVSVGNPLKRQPHTTARRKAWVRRHLQSAGYPAARRAERFYARFFCCHGLGLGFLGLAFFKFLDCRWRPKLKANSQSGKPGKHNGAPAERP
jgi:delta 1-pyrroline-5-carboxylate dehydrogenase